MSTIVIIECISWLIKVTDNNDARWNPEIDRGPCLKPVFSTLMSSRLSEGRAGNTEDL